MKPLEIFDTTLRDGEQAPGYGMSISQKISIARSLEALGVNTIECGFPASSPKDFQTANFLSTAITRASLCVFARANFADIEMAHRAVHRAGSYSVLVMTSCSDIHLTHKRRITREAALTEAKKAVRFARQIGFTDILVGPEDATRCHPDFLQQMIDTCIEAGATAIVVPDTVGSCLPYEYGKVIERVRNWVGHDIRISAHTHNDMGLATANALAAVEAGVDECQVTLCGIGERAGNAALEEVVAAIVSKSTHFDRSLTLDTKNIHKTCTNFLALLDIPISRSKAIVGENAFSTSAGIHQSGMIRDSKTYEFVNPDSFGAARRILISRHSGKEALRTKFLSLGVSVDSTMLDRTYELIKTSDKTSVFTDADLLGFAGCESGGQ